MTWLKKLGFIFLAVGLICIFIAVVLPATHDWTPVRMPISLVPGTITSPEFKTDLDVNYEINVEVDRKIEFDRLDCLLGNHASFLEPCNNVPELIDIAWSVTSKGKTIAAGSSDDVHDGGWGPTIERTIGRFQADKGRRYVVHLTVKKDASELAVTNPKLKVGVHPAEYKGTIVWAMLVATLGWGLILLSLLIFAVFGLVYLVKRRKRSRSSIESAS